MKKKMETYFAPAAREDKKQLKTDVEIIHNQKIINTILDSLPEGILLLNNCQQILYANNAFYRLSGKESLESILGLRPGETLSCIHSSLEKSGCGTSHFCKYCDIVGVIMDAQKTGKAVAREARLTVGQEEGSVSFDFFVSSVPLEIENQTFMMLSITDISNEKRRLALERIFFHDLLNKAGSLSCLFENLSLTPDTGSTDTILQLASNLSAEIVEEIRTQRSILEAEKGELRITITEVTTQRLLKNITRLIGFHNSAYEKFVATDPASEDLKLKTDYFILSRILINMLKNALEAVPRGEKVTISCKKTGNSIRFAVHNMGVIDDDVKYQIFNRSFSTKGPDRGLGTYSMKLLGEKYLNGKTGFVSNEKTGTIFYLDLPV